MTEENQIRYISDMSDKASEASEDVTCDDVIILLKCKKCNEEKPTSDFYKNPTKRGCLSTCITCHKKKSCQYIRERNKTIKSSISEAIKPKLDELKKLQAEVLAEKKRLREISRSMLVPFPTSVKQFQPITIQITIDEYKKYKRYMMLFKRNNINVNVIDEKK